MFSRTNRRGRAKSLAKPAVGYAAEPLERRVLLSSSLLLFVANFANGTVGEYTASGATVDATLISGLDGPVSVAVSGSDLFVANHNGGTIGEYTTSGATVHATLISGLNAPEDIAVSGSDLFVTNETTDTIGEYTTSGATVNASLVSGLSQPYGVGVSGSDLFVTNIGAGTIGEYTTSGTMVNASLISGLSSPAGILVSRTNLYVANVGSDTVGEYTTSGGTVNASLISSLNDAYGIALSGADLFVANLGSNTIGEYTSSGATVNTSLVSAGLNSPVGIALTTGSVPVTSVSGIVYDDKNGDGIKERKEPGLANITVTLQKLKHKKPSGAAQTTATNADGDYSFTNLTAGDTYRISESVPRKDAITQPSTGDYTLTLSLGQDLTGENFGDHKKAKASVERASTPFATVAGPATSMASETDSSALLFGSQDQQGVFAD